MSDDYRRQYAASVEPPPTPHSDYAPNGIAPRLGHALLRLAADPDATDAVRGIARHVLAGGHHDVLPIFADALDEGGHPAADWFDWRHAPRGVAIDKALHAAIAGHRRVAGAAQRGGPRHIVLSPGWVGSDWKERVKRNLTPEKASAAVAASVPDVSKLDLAHSLMRLYRIQYGLMPQIIDGPQWRDAHLQDHNREIGRLPHEVDPTHLGIDTINVHLMTAPRRVNYDEMEAMRRRDDAGKLDHINVHRYPDTRR